VLIGAAFFGVTGVSNGAGSQVYVIFCEIMVKTREIMVKTREIMVNSRENISKSREIIPFSGLPFMEIALKASTGSMAFKLRTFLFQNFTFFHKKRGWRSNSHPLFTCLFIF
jgi:hypothetical protein